MHFLDTSEKVIELLPAEPEPLNDDKLLLQIHDFLKIADFKNQGNLKPVGLLSQFDAFFDIPL